MTEQEKQDGLKGLRDRQLELLAKMRQSDAHAAKCVKLNVAFADAYPDEAREYVEARDEYNANEAAIEALEAAEVDEVFDEKSRVI